MALGLIVGYDASQVPVMEGVDHQRQGVAAVSPAVLFVPTVWGHAPPDVPARGWRSTWHHGHSFSFSWLVGNSFGNAVWRSTR